jgi:hypothetical protein
MLTMPILPLLAGFGIGALVLTERGRKITKNGGREVFRLVNNHVNVKKLVGGGESYATYDEKDRGYESRSL